MDSGWNTGEEVDFPGYTVDADGNYTVTTADGLLAWNEAARNDLSINCTLTKDIDLTGEWTPIGTSGNTYKGTFDGGGHTITGLTVTGSNDYAGLFGYIGSGGKVMNVKLEGVQIESDNNISAVGGVAGYSYNGKIENCSVSGSVSGNGSAGGVVGSQIGGSITGCSSSATVKGVTFAGGIAGETNSGASLTGCYATGDVSVANNTTNAALAGGVVGYNFSGNLQACYATGSVTGSGTSYIYIGGVTGGNDDGTLTACYHANGTVSGPAGTTGGVAGRNFKVGSNDAIITACYWGGNGQTQGIGYNLAGTTGGTTEVDGTNVKWENTINPMNAALSGSGWQYEIGDEGLPVFN